MKKKSSLSSSRNIGNGLHSPYDAATEHLKYD